MEGDGSATAHGDCRDELQITVVMGKQEPGNNGRTMRPL
jgi:hypothetical protein